MTLLEPRHEIRKVGIILFEAQQHAEKSGDCNLSDEAREVARILASALVESAQAKLREIHMVLKGADE